MYVDESGDHQPPRPNDATSRYLGLCGVIVEMETDYSAIRRAFDEFRAKHLGKQDPDFPDVFHREAIIAKRGRFYVLKDPNRHAVFDRDLLEWFESSSYAVIVVAWDKLVTTALPGGGEHCYHSALMQMMERYIGFLEANDGAGDVVSEARGKNEDRDLKHWFKSFCSTGSEYFLPERISARVTSGELKLRHKECDCPCLQMADLLAAPLKWDVLISRGRVTKELTSFEKAVLAVAESKYNRSLDGRIKGYGRVLFEEKDEKSEGRENSRPSPQIV